MESFSASEAIADPPSVEQWKLHYKALVAIYLGEFKNAVVYYGFNFAVEEVRLEFQLQGWKDEVGACPEHILPLEVKAEVYRDAEQMKADVLQAC